MLLICYSSIGGLPIRDRDFYHVILCGSRFGHLGMSHQKSSLGYYRFDMRSKKNMKFDSAEVLTATVYEKILRCSEFLLHNGAIG